MKYKTINVDIDTYNELRRLADAQHRSLAKTIAWLLDLLRQSKTYQVTSVTELPHPDGAEPVKVFEVEAK